MSLTVLFTVLGISVSLLVGALSFKTEWGAFQAQMEVLEQRQMKILDKVQDNGEKIHGLDVRLTRVEETIRIQNGK